jgi:hypothetical protein
MKAKSVVLIYGMMIASSFLVFVVYVFSRSRGLGARAFCIAGSFIPIARMSHGTAMFMGERDEAFCANRPDYHLARSSYRRCRGSHEESQWVSPLTLEAAPLRIDSCHDGSTERS